MSAYLFAAAPDMRSGYLFSDAACYADDGIVQAFSNKTSVAKSVPFAITSVGHRDHGDKVKKFLRDKAEVLGVDAFFEDFLPAFVAQLAVSYVEDIQHPGQHLAFLIAAYSPSKGAFRTSFQTFDEPSRDDIRAFEIRIDRDFTARGGQIDASRFGELRMPDGSESVADYMRYLGSTFVQFMREVPGVPVHMQGSEATPFYLIGGHLDMTIVDQDGARTERIHAWPDKVGERLDPFSRAQSGNRRQRRAAAKLAA